MNSVGLAGVVDKSLDAVLAEFPQPLDELASGRVLAFVFRAAYPPSWRRSLVDRLVREELLYDSRQPIPEKFLEAAIPEGYYREGRNGEASQTWESKKQEGRTRIDIGTSLGYRGSDQKAFFAHAAETHALFQRLFADGDNPIQIIYDALARLGCGRQVMTAHEPDGRRYGPAIIRAHYGGYTYKPHFDSVRLREKREDFAAYQFDHRFAGVLVLQNSQLDGATAQGILHHCLWEPEIDPHLKNDTFHEYARQHGIGHTAVHLEPGDLYFFNTRLIHEVPGVAGELPRVVLATFVGYSPSRNEIFVWS